MSIVTLAAPVRPSPVDDLTPEELAWMNGPGREGRSEWFPSGFRVVDASRVGTFATAGRRHFSSSGPVIE